jgi:dihydrofolate reductase
MKVILAVSPDWGIADVNGNLLYHDPQDMRLFKGLTYGHPVVAGYRTAKTLEGGLRGRDCLVDSKVGLIGWKPLLNCCPQDAWLIGGAKTVTKRLATIAEFWLSKFKVTPEKETGVRLCDRTLSVIENCNKITVAKFDKFDLVRYIV